MMAKSELIALSFSIQLLLVSMSSGTVVTGSPEINDLCPILEEDSATYLPNPDDCSTYYECSWGVAYLVHCPQSLYFDMNLKVCTWQWEAQCYVVTKQTTAYSTEPETAAGNTAEPETTAVHTVEPKTTAGYTVEPETTTGYTVKPETTAIHTVEPKTTAIHTVEPETTVVHSTEPRTTAVHTVEPKTTALHTVKPETTAVQTVEPETTAVHTTKTTAITEISTTPPLVFQCPRVDGATPIYLANPSDCSSFYLCHDGPPYLLFCPIGTFFDQTRQLCNIEAKVYCNIILEWIPIIVHTKKNGSL